MAISLDELDKQDIVDSFRLRATGLRRQGFFTLMLVAGLLASAVWVFFEAATITGRDVQTKPLTSAGITDRISQILSEMPEEPESLTPFDVLQYPEFKKLLNEFREIEATFIAALMIPEHAAEISYSEDDIDPDFFYNLSEDFYGSNDRPAIVVEITEPRDMVISFPMGLVIDPTIHRMPYSEGVALDESVIKLIERSYLVARRANETAKSFVDKRKEEHARWTRETLPLRNELDELREGRSLVLEHERKMKFGLIQQGADKSNVDIAFIVQTNITRFGPMIIILFFVSILVNLYRYSMRLAAYYDARADAIQLMELGVDVDKYTIQVNALSPDSHDIGKAPRVPTDQVIDLAKTVANKAQPKTAS